MDVDGIRDLVKKDGVIFLTYGGFLTQTLITGITEALEAEAEQNDLNMGIANNIFTIFIELSQNIMNYSKNQHENNLDVNSEGLIIVGKDNEQNYYIHSQNIISNKDREKIEPKLKEILSMSKDEIKKRYRELRRSGRHTHDKGGGIGFYEIAKRCDKISFEFKKINENKYYFHFISQIKTKKS